VTVGAALLVPELLLLLNELEFTMDTLLKSDAGSSALPEVISDPLFDSIPDGSDSDKSSESCEVLSLSVADKNSEDELSVDMVGKDLSQDTSDKINIETIHITLKIILHFI
jgi:hypothetical protein